ncbi:MAG: phenylacetate--CoA ligase family protein [Nonlabens sp.]
MDLFRTALKLKGFPIDKAEKTFNEISSLPEAEFEQYINSSKQAIVDYHLENNPLYKTIARGKAAEDWQDLPIVTKAELQKPLEQRITPGFENKVHSGKTSGSSGVPMFYIKDKFAHAMTWANILNEYAQHGVEYGSSYQARFYGIALDPIGYRRERFKDFLSSRYRFSVYDLSDKVLSTYVDVFTKRKFTYIYGYTSSIVLFAKYLITNKIKLSGLCPTLKCCITTSEMLSDEDRVILNKALGIPIVNEYGASEVGLLAFTGTDGKMYIDTRNLFVEVLDDDGNCVPDGTSGRIVVTSLYNKAQPIIRYEVGDRGTLLPGSSPKFKILKSLEGRTNDIAHLPSGKKVPGMTIYNLTKSVIDYSANVKEFVVVQTAPDKFEVRYTAHNKLTVEEESVIVDGFNKYLEPGLTINIVKQEAIDRAASGKLKQFTTMVK